MRFMQWLSIISILGSITMTAHSSVIGTVDHPTIDGGIINENSHSANFVNLAIDKPFNDDWATDQRVKNLLIAATHQGKLAFVLKKTEQMNLPASVAVIPMIESNYNLHAVSKKGAAGVWQLMPKTAKEYGIDAEKRFQLDEASEAALKLLNDLHRQFGKWTLAYAAYNAGSKRVADALHQNPRATTIDDLALPQETKNYVHRLNQLNTYFIKTEKNLYE